jgi:hypothetical protein
MSHPATNARVRPVMSAAFIRIGVLSEWAVSPGKAVSLALDLHNVKR